MKVTITEADVREALESLQPRIRPEVLQEVAVAIRSTTLSREIARYEELLLHFEAEDKRLKGRGRKGRHAAIVVRILSSDLQDRRAMLREAVQP